MNSYVKPILDITTSLRGLRITIANYIGIFQGNVGRR